jgi:pimeloyl-ACP methyl ester carboxylesterase
MSRAFDATLMPDATPRDALRASAEPYLERTLRDDPRRFLTFADDTVVPTTRVEGRRPIDGGTIVSYVLASDYVPFDPSAERHPNNDWMPVEHWTHDRPAPATVVAVHGFTMGDPVIGAQALMADDWFRLGLDVVLLTLPFHGARTAPQARYSGEIFASWHVGRLNEAVRQSIYDLRHVTAWLRAAGHATIGIVGISLGGYLSAVLAALDPDLAFAIPIAAPVHLGTFPSTLFAHSRYARRTPPPFTADELRDAYRAHCPLTHALAIAPERTLVVAGRGDRIVPPEQPLALWEHWQRPPIHWFGGSHVTPFRRAAVFAAGARHVRGLGIPTNGEGDAHEPRT